MRILFAALAALVLVSSPHAAPLEAYGKLRAIEQINLSPDGSKLAYVRRQGQSETIVVEEAQGARPVGGFNLGGQKFRSMDWAGPNHLWISTSLTAAPRMGAYVFQLGEYSQLQIYDLTTKTFRIVPDLKDAPRIITGQPAYRLVDGKPTLFVEGLLLTGAAYTALYRIDVATGAVQVLDKVTGGQARWMIDAAGRPATRTEYDAKTGVWRMLLPDPDGGWRAAGTLTDPTHRPGLMAFGPKPGTVLGRRMENERPVFREVSLTDGTWGDIVAIAPDLRGWIFDSKTQLLVGMTEGHETAKTRFLDPAEQATWEKFVRAFKGDTVTVFSWSDDRKTLVATVDGGATGVAYVLINRDKGTAEVIGSIYEGLGSADIAQPRWITYKAADGLPIKAILTLPKGREPKGLPLVVAPHNGPQDRDIVEYQWLAQALVSRGYAVLQPNYRGSGGFGPEFVQAGYGEWGRKMQSDVSDGVRHLAAEGIIDAGRVCVVGHGAYGGYAALAGVTLEQGVYRCAVSVAGIADINPYMAWRQSRMQVSDNGAMRRLREFLGVERGETAPRDRISPAKLAARAGAPVLLIHGKDDTTVPYAQSEAMAKALQGAGRSAEFVTLAREDHWLSRGETRLQMLTATVDFLERHNPPK